MSVAPDAVYDSTTAADATSALPPLTAAIRQVWRDSTTTSAAIGTIASPDAVSALLNAIYALETRVITLDGGS